MFRYLSIVMIVLTFAFCNQGPDPALQEALKIQDEAIHLGMDMNQAINDMIVSDTTKQSHNVLGQLLVQLKQWEKEMIPVPGVQHDHDHGHAAGSQPKDSTGVAKEDNHDHDHDHHGHVHATGAEIAAQLTPAENKEAQIEWKNRLLEIQAEFEKAKKSFGK